MANSNAVFKALAGSSRRRIVEALSRQPMTVRELTDKLPISQSAVSQHLEVLRKAQLVSFERRGASNIYRIDPRGIGAIRAWLDQYWSRALEKYAKLVEEDESKDR